MRNTRGSLHPLLISTLMCSGWLCSGGAKAQAVFEQDELLASDRPEAWAMNYVTAASLMTGFGEPATLVPGRWSIGLELGHVPRLNEAQRRVGFNGSKAEDLNKSPVFGRLRLAMELPKRWTVEVGYTPPVSINGARPRDLIALAVGRRVFERNGNTLSVRAFGQHGAARGDITCPAELAGLTDSELNPYGCQAPSDDRIALNYYGIDLAAGWAAGGSWRWHTGLGAARTEPEVQVDALTFDVRDRSRLVARDVLFFAGIGASRGLNAHWNLGVDVMHVPLRVRRAPGLARENDPLTSLRLQLRYRSE